MARLTPDARDALPKSAFAGPDRSFPIPDASHARNALSQLPKSQKAGNISDKFAAAVKAKAKAKLGGEPDADDAPGAKRGGGMSY